MEHMPAKTVDDFRQRAIATIRELHESRHSILAETLRPYRVRHIENMLHALKSRADGPGTTSEEKRLARRAIAEIESMFDDATGTLA